MKKNFYHPVIVITDFFNSDCSKQQSCCSYVDIKNILCVLSGLDNTDIYLQMYSDFN